MVILQNKNVIAEISEVGAEIKSLKVMGKSCFWTPVAEIWGGTAPLLFPICGGLKNDTFTYEGKTYRLQKHGYARFSTFTVEAQGGTSATLLHTSDCDTLQVYPFAYELRVIYTLTDAGVAVTYRVTNTQEKPMYFSIGSHEAYFTPEGIEDYDIIFPEKETLNSVMLDGNLLQKHTLPIMKNSHVLPLYDKHFAVDALVFTDVKSKSATLRNRKTGSFVTVDFPGKPYLLLWHKYGAPYMCIEPWCGIPDAQDEDGDITKKTGIIALEGKDTYEITHTITMGVEA